MSKHKYERPGPVVVTDQGVAYADDPSTVAILVHRCDALALASALEGNPYQVDQTPGGLYPRVAARVRAAIKVRRDAEDQLIRETFGVEAVQA